MQTGGCPDCGVCAAVDVHYLRTGGARSRTLKDPQSGKWEARQIDVPSGRVTARVHREDARVVAVDFVNVPSWVVARDVPVTTSLGEVRVTVAYGGAIYATLPATQLGHRHGQVSDQIGGSCRSDDRRALTVGSEASEPGPARSGARRAGAACCRFARGGSRRRYGDVIGNFPV